MAIGKRQLAFLIASAFAVRPSFAAPPDAQEISPSTTEAAARGALADSILTAKERSLGEPFEARLRASLKSRMEALSMEQLAALSQQGETADLPSALGSATSDLVYTPVTPCRVFDSRVSQGGPGPIPANGQRNVFVAGTLGFPAQGGTAGGCGIPIGATSVIINFVAVLPSGPGNIRGWAVANPQPPAPLAAIINYGTVVGLPAIANGVPVPLCNPAATSCALGDLRLQADTSATDLIGDVVGYFGPATGLVTSVNSVTGPVTIAAGSNISVTPSGSTLTIASTAPVNPGTVTSVATGQGLVGGPITGAGTVDLLLNPAGGLTKGLGAGTNELGIAGGGVGLSQINTAQVQARVAGACSAGSSIRVVNTDGTVACQLDSNSGGTVTGVTAGAGLAGGSISTSGTISVATGGVTSTMIGSGQVVKGLNGLADTVTIAGSGGATVSTVGSTITVAAALPLPSGAVILGLSGDTTLIGAGYSKMVDVQQLWTSTDIAGAPGGRYLHSAVWTGSRMVVWGGYEGTTNLNTGGQYDPVGNSWTATATTPGVPSPRQQHAAVWTGSKMIVWGGYDGTYLDTGGQYDPVADSWQTTATTPGVPSPRAQHTAIWTGSEMIVWGGWSGTYHGTGGRYDPAGDSWTAPTAMPGAPSPRTQHTAVWTGSRMIVWGGTGGTSLDTGGQYDPAGDSWTATATTPGVPGARFYHTAVWTGSKMIVWGGTNGTNLNTGGQYDPVAGGPSGSWTSTATAGAPSARYVHSAVWTGSKMIVWGGIDVTPGNTGSQYDPVGDSWEATATTPGVPSGRYFHTAVWTGLRMIVWGGFAGGYANHGAQWFVLSYYIKN